MSDNETEYSEEYSDDEEISNRKKPTFSVKKDKLTLIQSGGQDTDDEDEDDDYDEYEEETEKPQSSQSKDVKQKSIEQLASVIDDSGDEEDDEDDDEDDDEYLQKFDREVVTNYLDLFHPESKTHNYDEIKLLSVVTRNDKGQIIDKLHRTIPILTKFEKTRVLGLRAKQIDEGAVPFVKLPSNVIDGYTIAIQELEQKKIPFIIRRPLPNGGSEYWKLSDLELI
jgi:DNA-directed RNA polymerases I, II, and III subunit RPABC2